MAERCYCGNWVVPKTAWTTSNAGRRFFSCDRCRFFRWLDDPLCQRARVIIPGLIRRINNLEAQLKRGESSNAGICSSEVHCEVEGSRIISEVVSEKKSGSNTALTLLIVTWIAIFVFSFCKIEEAEDI